MSWMERVDHEGNGGKSGNPAHIRVVVVDGKVFMEKYEWVFQTRHVLTIWCILQLLRMYPGKLPDLDLIFECGAKNRCSRHMTTKDLMPLLHQHCFITVEMMKHLILSSGTGHFGVGNLL
uniref:Glycosyl transferase CAP10 domain-containing protein n=1 Tax=Vitis vinifera TaxID=29760 RepID=F6I603_VITVI